MKNMHIVTMYNEYGIEEMEMFLFTKKANAISFIEKQIDGIISCGYVEDDMTKDKDDLWFFNYGNSQVVIKLIKKEIR